MSRASAPLRRTPSAAVAEALAALSPRRLRAPLAACALAAFAALLAAAWEGHGAGFGLAAGVSMAMSGAVALVVMCAAGAVVCWRAVARFWWAVRPRNRAGVVFAVAALASMAAAAILLCTLYAAGVQERIGVLGIGALCATVALAGVAAPFAAAAMSAHRKRSRS